MRGVRKLSKRISGYALVENPSSVAARSSGDFWPVYNLSSAEEFGSYSSSEFLLSSTTLSKQSQKYGPPKTKNYVGYIPSKEDRNRAIRKKLLEREMLHNRRIMMQQRREDERKALVEEQQQKMKQQWQTKNQMNAAVNFARRRTVDQIKERKKHAILVKIMREDGARIRHLGESRDIERREKEDIYYRKVMKSLREMEEASDRTQSALTEGPDKVYTELWFRQERLLRAISDKSLPDIQALLAFSPTILQVRQEKIYEDYAPHKQLQLLVNELVAKSISEEFFFEEAAELAKKLTPAHIIEHYRRVEANKHNRRKLMRVSSQTMVDRYTVAWSSGRLNDAKARPVAQRVVDDTVQLAQGVYSRMMQGSSCNLALIGIGSMDEQEQSESGEHVHFDDKKTEIPRPLEPGQLVQDLKSTVGRPCTPVPSDERLRNMLRMMPEVDDSKLMLIEQIVTEAERQLHQNIDSGSVDRERADKMVTTESMASMRKNLKADVMEKLEKLQTNEDVTVTEREEFVKDISKLVSDVVGSTVHDAKSVLKNALDITQGKLSHLLGSQKSSDGKIKAHETFEEHLKRTLDVCPQESNETEQGVCRDAKLEYKPTFGGKPLKLNKRVLESSLAAISVAHGADGPGHEGHSHLPPVSHLKEFMKSRGSLPATHTSPMLAHTFRKRCSLPSALPVCMDSSKMQLRHSFMDVFEPDLHDLPEYRDKTSAQVEQVLVDHSTFGNLQELPETISEEDCLLHVENLDEEHGQETPGLETPDQETPDQETPPVEEHPDDRPVSEPVEKPHFDSESAAKPYLDTEPVETPGFDRRFSDMMAARGLSMVPGRLSHTTSVLLPRKMASSFSQMPHDLQPKRLSASAVLLRCDSDPKLSLRHSRAEFGISLEQHDTSHCTDHVSEPEPEELLQTVESFALGIGVKETTSDVKIKIFSDTPCASDSGKFKESIMSKHSRTGSHDQIAEADETEASEHNAPNAAEQGRPGSASPGQLAVRTRMAPRPSIASDEDLSQPLFRGTYESRLMLRSDSNPNLVLHTSRAVLGVSLHDDEHDEHETHDQETHEQPGEGAKSVEETTSEIEVMTPGAANSSGSGSGVVRNVVQSVLNPIDSSESVAEVELSANLIHEQPTDRDPQMSPRHLEVETRMAPRPSITSDEDLSQPLFRGTYESRLMLRSDSNPNLVLRPSRAELGVSLHDHECMEHESHHETRDELQAVESAALGLGVKETTSDVEVTPSSTAHSSRSGSRSGSRAGSGAARNVINSGNHPSRQRKGESRS